MVCLGAGGNVEWLGAGVEMGVWGRLRHLETASGGCVEWLGRRGRGAWAGARAGLWGR
ncbi:hypothetical protein Aglo03_33600 [Actinokineospora globicatena]|uniref:Uncharacterized protein n=1 Tax=Actinokineospora globicatena TaxID=103729 RepID=A0A9W6QQ26_9PSEU|nr:hypothetical protein Aglo03_33600 [Actinokineospora globicatena]